MPLNEYLNMYLHDKRIRFPDTLQLFLLVKTF